MVESVKHISILCMKEDRETLVKALQKCGEVMLDETPESTRGSSPSAEQLRRIEKLSGEISKFKPKLGLIAKLKAETPTVDEKTFDTLSEEGLAKANDLEAMISETEDLSNALKETEAQIRELAPWEKLGVKLSSLECDETEYTVLIPGTFKTAFAEKTSKTAEENGIGLEIVSNDEKTVYAVIAVMNGESYSPLTAIGFEKVTLPNKEVTPAELLVSLEKKKSEIETRLGTIRAKLAEEAEKETATSLLTEQYRVASERESVPFTETAETVFIEGWVPEKRVEKAIDAVKKAVEICDIYTRDPIDGETPPTILKNNKIVSQFEGITNMFSVPAYGGIDPNPVMAPWYWIIFGLMMGDAGYGLMMLVFCLLFRFVIKPKGGMLQICNVILYSSVTSIIAGIVFGSYFGGSIFPPLWFSTISFDGSNSDGPIKMLIFTLGVGVLHLLTGLVVKAYYSIKDGQWLDAIFDDFSWIAILIGICAFAGGMALEISVLSTVGLIVTIIGAVIVICTAGRAKPNIFGKVAGGFVGLYGITGYMSDILSYSRILALGLSTGVVGWVMNYLADMVANSIPVAGWIFAVLIYIVGHIFNLVLGLLSAYVHDSRLQYIEFYGKFYEGNGKLFKPFKVQTNKINISNNTEEN